MNAALLSSKSNEWRTPQAFFNELDREFHFTLDPASTDENAKCAKHYTAEDNGLMQDWTGETVFCIIRSQYQGIHNVHSEAPILLSA